MHEFAVAQALVEMASQTAHHHGAARVTRLQCRVGVMRQIDRSLLSEAFDAVRAGTVCQAAELSIETCDMTAFCPACRRRFVIRDADWRCDHCGREGQDIRGGDELELVTIDAEDRDEHPSPAECLCQE